MRAALLALLVAFLALPALHARQSASPLAGTWIGTGSENEGARMRLDADGGGDLDGRSIQWKAWGKSRLRVTWEGQTLRGTYALDEPRLVLTFGEDRFEYLRQGPAPQAAQELQGFVVPPPLTGARVGQTHPYAHPKGYFTCALPLGWTVARESEDALLVNPGLSEKDTLDALILMTWGQLEAADRGLRPAQLIDRDEAQFREWMREQQIVLSKAAQKAESVLVGDVPGATQEWRGKTSEGRAVRLWLGGIVKREYSLAVVVVLLDEHAERAEAYLSGVKQVFASLRATPPQRNAAVEAALAGHEVSKDGSGSGGFLASTYDFRADGSVKKEILMSGVSGLYDVSGSTEEWGRYEVVGDLLYLYFKDGQECASVVVEGQAVVGVRFGSSVCRLR